MNTTTTTPQRPTFSSVRDGCSLSAHRGQGKAPLKDVSNVKKPSNKPTTKVKVGKMVHSSNDEEKVAAGSFNLKLSKMTIKLNEDNLRLLNHVASEWSTGKGVCQTPWCMKVIRISLNRGIPRDDLANYVAAGLSDEVQAMELKRAKACVTRIYNSMTTIEKPKKNSPHEEDEALARSIWLLIN